MGQSADLKTAETQCPGRGEGGREVEMDNKRER